MDYIREYKKFIGGYNFGHGLQTTFCIVSPTVAGFYLDLLTPGILISLGAICVSSIDTPGPPKHRRNGLLLGAGCVMLSALAMSSYVLNEWLGNFIILSLVFSLSMIAVYGIRVTNIGLAGIYTLVLITESKNDFHTYLTHAGLFFAGAIWYGFIILLTYSFRPYQLIRQALSDCIFKTADYLRLRAGFYQSKIDSERQFDLLISMQVEVSNSHQVVRRLLLQRFSTTRESTMKSRSLLLILIETIDIFEQVMAAHIDTNELHQIFDGNDILDHYRLVILNLATELDSVATAIGAGKSSVFKTDFKQKIDLLEQNTHSIRSDLMNEKSLGAFINLLNVRKNISQIVEKIGRLHRYSIMSGEGELTSIELINFVEKEDYSWQKLKSNLGRHSLYFRHAVRVSLAIAAGILISEFFPIQRGYWILFTIVVILKPGFSLSKSRNSDRIIGTLAGGLTTFMILLFIKTKVILFIILVICMIITYSFAAINYALSTFTTTCFVLLFLNFLKPGDFSFIELRLVDTAIGSGLSFLSSYFIFPVWEYQRLDGLLVDMTRSNIRYFSSVATSYTGIGFEENDYKLARKQVYIKSADLASAFQRMLTEPKSKQQNLNQLHEYLVLSSELSAHIASLALYKQLYAVDATFHFFEQIIEASIINLDQSVSIIENHLQPDKIIIADFPKLSSLSRLDTELNTLAGLRIQEINAGLEKSDLTAPLNDLKLVSDQFRYIYKLSQDILKVSRNITLK